MSANENITIEELRRLVGDLEEEKLSEILALDASVADIEMAVMRAGGEDGMLSMTGHPLDAKVAAIVEILTADEDEEEH